MIYSLLIGISSIVGLFTICRYVCHRSVALHTEELLRLREQSKQLKNQLHIDEITEVLSSYFENKNI